MTVKEKEQHEKVRRKANAYFFAKVIINAFLVFLGAVLIAGFLRSMQHSASLYRQQENSSKALSEAIETLKNNTEDAKDLELIFHDSNQDMLDDLNALISSGMFEFLKDTDVQGRSDVFADIVSRSGVDYLFILDDQGRVILSPTAEFFNVDPVEYGLVSRDDIRQLQQGTKDSAGSIKPVLVRNQYGVYYFYSVKRDYEGMNIYLVLGADASLLELQISSLNDLSVVLSKSAIGNEGFMFAVDRSDNSFLYYNAGGIDLKGTSAIDAGLSPEALEDGYSGLQVINGVRYYCVSRTYGLRTVICAVADTVVIYANDKYVLFWSITGFVLIMLLCLAFGVIVRNDFIRRAADTDKFIIHRKNGDNIIFDKSIFKRVFPLMLCGVFLIFSISFYTQTLLEISQSIDDSVTALDEVTNRYQESTKNREIIRTYFNDRFLSKAKLISYLVNVAPDVLNTETERVYTYYGEDGTKRYILDDEDNPLRSVSSSAILQALCDSNDLDSVYVYNEDGRTIATNTPNWFFTISHDPENQSYPFLEVIDGKIDFYIQEAMLDEMGQDSQYIGVMLDYYTTLDADGNTLYVPHYVYENYLPDTESLYTSPIHKHRSMVQIGLKKDITDRLMASTDAGSILSSDMLSGGFIVMFDTTEDHICLYSPVESSIGRAAADMGVSAKAFGTGDYYGFTKVNGVDYFQYFRYLEGYYIGTAIPEDQMYRARLPIASITALTSLILILILILTVTLTTDEEEYLYATMSESDANNSLDSAIFNILLPSGKNTSTVKAAARWDNRRIPWGERSPEQKLLFLMSIVGVIMLFYVIIAVIGVDRFFEEGSIIQYILRGEWDRGMNIFAFSACALVLIMTSVAVTIFRLVVRLITSLLGARGETIAHLLLSVVKYGGTLGAFFYCLYLIGMDAHNLLASAGVLSLVIGLGAQSLIKDIIAGIFIVFEGEFRVGDIVTIGGYRGTVMDIGLRTTKIQSPDGNIKIYNNSEISGVLNMTKEASVASATISIEYGQDIDYVEAVLKRELPLLKERNDKILDGPTYLGVSKLGESGVDLLIICKCFEKDIRGVSRYLNAEVLKIFYRNDINVPFPNVTISQLDMTGRKTMADFEKEEQEKEARKEGS